MPPLPLPPLAGKFTAELCQIIAGGFGVMSTHLHRLVSPNFSPTLQTIQFHHQFRSGMGSD